MSERDRGNAEAADLDVVSTTEELARRPARRPDHAAEAGALAALAHTMAVSPATVLQRIVDTILALCRVDSAGLDVLEETGRGPRVLRWAALAGSWAGQMGGLIPEDESPSRIALERGRALLFHRPGRRFPGVAAVSPPIVEALVIPFEYEGRPIGTVWANVHTTDRRLDAEDARLLESLSRFAAAAYRMTAVLDAAEAGRLTLERRVAGRTAELAEASSALRESERQHRTLFEAIDEGLCVVEVLFDPGGTPVDYRFLEVNPAFEGQTGLQDATGKTMRELVPQHEPHWFETYGRIARTGRPERFVNEAQHLGGRWFDVYAFRIARPEDRRVAILFNDITERRRMEEALREADRRKDEFLAMLGHELRNPLAPLRGIVETLGRQRLGEPALERVRGIMARQVKHLTRLVDDLLDVSRITRGLIELQREPVDLVDVADQVVEMATALIERRSHHLSLTLPRRPLLVEGDATRLMQVVLNLLNNAAKYTDPGGRIRLLVEREGEHAVVRVEDNGAGMSPELLPRVFDLFTQAKRTPDRAQGGLGLGLTLVKRLVELHGGSVEAHSKGAGKGSELIVRLPALPEVSADERPPAEAPGPSPVEAQVARALVIDDNLDVAETLTWMLEGLAREIQVVHSGAEALEAAPGFCPDVVLCDLGMPGMDGYETCEHLRRLPGLEKCTIAAVSGYDGEDERQRSKAAGFDRHLVKPVGRVSLEELVRAVAAPKRP